MSQPNLLLVPFGSSAASGTIEPIPTARGAGDPPQKATWNEGFPSVTMTPLAAGGIPPKGQDFNGVLKAISEHTAFLCAGGIYKWNSAVVSVAGGYAKGAIVQSNDGLSAYVSAIDGNTINFNSTPASIGVQWLVWTGNAKANANITISAGTGLSGGGDLSTNRTLSVVYGTAAGTSAQGNDSRITGAAQRSANLSDLASAATARTNLGLGSAATATLTTTLTDSTAGRVTKNGDWGIGSSSQAPGLSDFKALAPGALYRGVFSAVANGPSAAAVFFSAIPIATSSTTVMWLVYTQTSIYLGYYNSSAGTITWNESYGKGNTSAAIQAFLAAADNAAARTALGVPAGVDKQMCTAWVNFNGTGTVAIRDSFGVTSITDNAVGNYTLNFSVAMENINYSLSGTARTTSSVSTGGSLCLLEGDTKTTSSVQVRVNGNDASGNSVRDASEVNVNVFGGK